ncbi:mannose-1-phosphate guanylyltransferase [Paenibacillus selenitireducens]|uniref:Mannose-1-phosphate guanylyltransferase n=1 Tax=Paenibacillus selenitireducens TaxID=1324314 RepID=A0A1T2XKE9_9BACL|nr:sugar phosphate nucleotidyltransferase [Paenibacillus selenitireducens]OPA80206.1 mannose-1-phosphate guanylyltransferase [Paenibacillus selenitireducens]
MRLVLLSGGSGKRLWPLSNDARSKQFLKVLVNDKGQYESMIQRVWRQLQDAGLADHTLIATSSAQREIVFNQIEGHVNVVVEPDRRDTFAAIVLSALYMRAEQGMDANEVITVMPVDPFVEASFFDRIQDMESALNDASADLALIGVRPSYPAEIYGYIVPHQSDGKRYKRVNYFKEKPDEALATKLLQEHALWNCGVFSFRLSFILSILEKKGLPTDYHAFLAGYKQLNSNSFDYEVVEHTRRIIVLPFEGFWKDLGTWDTLTDEIENPVVGKGIIKNKDPHTCANNHIVNELDIPVAVIGLSDVIVAASPDGILVSTKEASPQVKGIVHEFESKPMYVERRWGWYRIIDFYQSEDGLEVNTRRIQIKAGKNLSYHTHHHRKELWTILRGEAQVMIGDQLLSVKACDTIQIDAGIGHAMKAITDLEFIEVQMGHDITEQDITRIFLEWKDILELGLI